MSIQEIPNTKPYITIYNDVVSNIDKSTSHLILSAKKKAFDNLMDSGFPTHRKGNEDWKYTDVNKILQNEYKLFEKTCTIQKSSGRFKSDKSWQTPDRW